jgi:hypothetical protein
MKSIEAVVTQMTIAANYLAGPRPNGEPHAPDPGEVEDEQLRRVLPARDEIELIMRYEAHLRRGWITALHELQVLQARRLGERPNLMRFDVNVTPAA